MLARLTISDHYARTVGSYILVPTYEKFATRLMRERFGLKKFQRGILQLATGGTMIAAGGGGTIPAVTDILLFDTGSTGAARTSIRYHDDRAAAGSNDGRILTKLHQNNGASTYTDLGNDDTPTDHTGEWTTDVVTESDFEVACTSEDTGTWDESFAAVGVFTGLDTADMAWSEFRGGGKGRAAGTNQCIATFEIREVADTGNNTVFEVDCTADQT